MKLKQLLIETFPERWFRWMTAVLLVLNAAGWASVWRWAPRNLEISPLHYTIYFGINLTGPWMMLYWLPTFGLAAIVSHLIISRMIHHAMWRRLWLILAVVINVIALVDLAAILILLHTNIF